MKGIGERNNMEEWKEYKLGDVSSVSSSKRIFADEYQSEGIPFYRSKEIIEKQKGISIANELYIKESRYNEIKNKFGVPQKGDILLTSVGTLGIPYLVKDEIFYFKDGNITWFYNFKGINNRYLYYWFLSPIAKHYFDIKAIGSTQKALTIETLKKFDIVLPSKSIQQKVADVLKSFDDKIELNNRINANLEEQAQALFRRWFVDFEFPNEQGLPYKSNGGAFVDSELGKIPNGWKVFHADEVFHINIGKTPPRKEQEWFSNESKNNIKWVSISDLGGIGVFVNDSKEYLSKDAISKFNIIVVPRNTVLLSFKLTVGRVAIANCKLTTNEAIARFYLPKEYFREYTYLALKNYNYSKLGSTSSIAIAVNSKIIKAMPILIPSDNILKLFNVVMAPVFNIIEKNQTTIENLVSLRDTLLPKLMNNEINL
jgi:type I restriction enzyme S subunit